MFASNIDKEKSFIMDEYKKYISESWRPDGVLIDYVGKEFSPDDEKIILSQFSFFLNRLVEIHKYDAVLLSIGGSGKRSQQQLPDYMREFKKPNKVLVLDIDIAFFSENHRKMVQNNFSLFQNQEAKNRHIYSSPANNEDLTLEIFACYLPSHDCPLFSKFLENQIKKAMDNKKQIFIANHTQSYSLSDIPLIAEVYNRIKQSHSSPSTLQLYTQGGQSKQVTYYSDLSYDKRSNLEYRSPQTGELLIPNKDNPAFYLHSDIATLSALPEFQPMNIQKEAKPPAVSPIKR